jgi:hypothetical protein
MKQYTIDTGVWGDGYKATKDPDGDWVREEDANKMRDALIFITEYWNGNPDSAVDAIEEAISTAREALGIVDGEGN